MSVGFYTMEAVGMFPALPHAVIVHETHLVL